jgi:hypothetical protein
LPLLFSEIETHIKIATISYFCCGKKIREIIFLQFDLSFAVTYSVLAEELPDYPVGVAFPSQYSVAHCQPLAVGDLT